MKSHGKGYTLQDRSTLSRREVTHAPRTCSWPVDYVLHVCIQVDAGSTDPQQGLKGIDISIKASVALNFVTCRTDQVKMRCVGTRGTSSPTGFYPYP